MKIFCLVLGFALSYGAWSDAVTVVPDDGQVTQTKQLPKEASEFTDPEREKLVTEHNDLRSSLNASNMNYVEWDENLAGKAKEMAEQCVRGIIDVSDPVKLYMGPRMDAKTVLNTWRHFGDKCEKSGNACTYQQLLVPDSTKFGCAWKDCAGVNATKPAYLVVCQYDIKFRKDEHIITPGKPCSKCGENKPKCYKKLCMSKDLCDAKFKNDCACKIECEEGTKLDEDHCKCENYVGMWNMQVKDKLKDDALHLHKQVGTTEAPTDQPTISGNDTVEDTTYEDDEDDEEESPEASMPDSETCLLPTVNSILAGLLMWFMHASLLSKFLK